MQTEPKIRPLPTLEGFRRSVDKFIHADTPDGEIKAFVNVVMTTANPEDEQSWSLANDAARYAFMKSDAFEQAFKNFAELGPEFIATADRFTVESTRTM